MKTIPDVDLRYCILDAGDPTYLDFHFPQLIFLESFYSPAMVLKIGDPNSSKCPTIGA